MTTMATAVTMTTSTPTITMTPKVLKIDKKKFYLTFSFFFSFLDWISSKGALKKIKILAPDLKVLNKRIGNY
jgi:hypothetical protein